MTARAPGLDIQERVMEQMILPKTFATKEYFAQILGN